MAPRRDAQLAALGGVDHRRAHRTASVERMKRPGVRRWLSLPFGSAAARERDVDEEIGLHIALRADRLVQQGYARDVALREAERRFGGAGARNTLIEHAQHREKEMRIREWLVTTAADLRFTKRQLVRSPAFTIAAITTVALGVGANATMF